MRRLLLAGAAIGAIALSAAAMANGAGTSDPAFAKLVTQASASTDIAQTMEGEYRTISRISPSRDVDHTADYFSAVGASIDGKFAAFAVSIEAEVWTQDAAKNWLIDEWTYVIALDDKPVPTGRLIEVSHRVIEENADGDVIGWPPNPANPNIDDPAVRARFAGKIAEWEARQ